MALVQASTAVETGNTFYKRNIRLSHSNSLQGRADVTGACNPEWGLALSSTVRRSLGPEIIYSLEVTPSYHLSTQPRTPGVCLLSQRQHSSQRQVTTEKHNPLPQLPAPLLYNKRPYTGTFAAIRPSPSPFAGVPTSAAPPSGRSLPPRSSHGFQHLARASMTALRAKASG